jgi:hypothetical protein
MKKRKKKNYKERLENLQNKINIFGHTLKNPINETFTDINTSSWFDINTSSWFDIKISENPNLFASNINTINDEVEHDGYYTRKIKVYPTYEQKQILFKWMEAYIMMYNVVTKYFKQCMFQKVNKKQLCNATFIKFISKSL